MADKALRVLGVVLNIDFSSLLPLNRAVLAVGLLLAAVSLGVSIGDGFRFGGADLRPKVVAARALLSGKEPYRYEWKPGISEEFLDPMRRHPGPGRATYTPGLLLAYGSLAWLPYRIQRLAWVLLEWAAMLASLLLLVRTLRDEQLQFWFLVIALYFFVSAHFWRIHVERGQYYIFLTLLISISHYLQINRRSSRWAGVPLGIGIVFRPTLALMAALLWILRGKRMAEGAALAAVLFFLLTLPIGGVQAWKSFLMNVREVERGLLSPGYVEKQYGPQIPVPRIVEGVDFSRILNSRSADVTPLGLALLAKDKLGIRSPVNPIGLSRFLAVVFVLLALVLAWLGRRKALSASQTLAISVSGAIIVEYFLPLRSGYGNVLFLLPLALILPELQRRPEFLGPAAAIVAGLAIGRPLISALEWAPSSVLQSVLLMGGCAWWAVRVLLGDGNCPDGAGDPGKRDGASV